MNDEPYPCDDCVNADTCDNWEAEFFVICADGNMVTERRAMIVTRWIFENGGIT